MATKILGSAIWRLVRRQHGAISRGQLLRFGLTSEAIRHRLRSGRLFQTEWRGVYAVGRRELTQDGRWMAAILACGEDTALAGQAGAALWGVLPHQHGRAIEVLVPPGARRKRPGIVVREGTRRIVQRRGIPVTSIVDTLVDVACGLTRDELEAAIGAADKLRLVTVPVLRAALDAAPPRPGVGVLKRTIDRRTYVLTHTYLERLLVPIALRAGLGKPDGQRRVGRDRVDFLWDYGLLVEVDGATYHRTPAQQTEDRRRDQDHAVAGLTTLRFTYAQVRFEPEHVERVLRAVAARLRREAA